MRKSPTRRRSTHTDLINSNDKVALLESLFLKLDSVENSLGSKLGELGKHHNGKPFPLIVGKSNIVVDVIKATNIPFPDITHVPEAYCSLTVDKAIVGASSIANPSSNPIWHDHFEIAVVKSKPSRKDLGKKLDLATIEKSFFYFQISSKNHAGADDYLGYVGLGGKDVISLCEKVTTGIKWFEIIPVVAKSSPSKKVKPKLALRFNATGHVPLIYNQVLLDVTKQRNEIEIVYKMIIENIKNKKDDMAEVDKRIRNIQINLEKVDMNLKKQVPHSLYCGLYDQLAAMRNQQESVNNLAEKLKVNDKIIKFEQDKVLKSLMDADDKMMKIDNVAKIRYSLAQIVKSALDAYVKHATKSIIQSLLKKQNYLISNMKKKSRRVFMDPVNILESKVVVQKTVSTEKAINKLNNIRNMEEKETNQVIQKALQEIDLLEHTIWEQMVNAIFNDWNMIYEKSNNTIQKKHGSHAKEMRKKSAKEEQYRITIKTCRNQLNHLLQMEEEIALSEAVVPQLQESHRLFGEFTRIEEIKGELEQQYKNKKIQFQKLNEKRKKEAKARSKSSNIFDIKLKKINAENEQIIASIESVDKQIKHYQQVLKSSPWKKKFRGAIGKVMAVNKIKGISKNSRKSRREGLPRGWKAYKDKSSGQTYYHNRKLNQTQWTVPTK